MGSTLKERESALSKSFANKPNNAPATPCDTSGVGESIKVVKSLDPHHL